MNPLDGNAWVQRAASLSQAAGYTLLNFTPVLSNSNPVSVGDKGEQQKTQGCPEDAPPHHDASTQAHREVPAQQQRLTALYLLLGK